MDPWGCEIVKTAEVVTKFEDNFTPSTISDKLSDSTEYLAVLGNYIYLYLIRVLIGVFTCLGTYITCEITTRIHYEVNRLVI